LLDKYLKLYPFDMPKIDEETLGQIRNELAEFTTVVNKNLSI